MPKFLDGYQTTLGSRFNTSKLSDALNESLIRDNLLTSSLDVKKIETLYPVFITALQDSDDQIPGFAHPYYFIPKHFGNREEKQLLVTDMRMYLRKKVFDGSLASLPSAISNKGEYQFARSRAILGLEWIEGDVEALKVELWFSTLMFTRWISDALTRALALNHADQIIISIVASYYYQALFTEALSYDDDTIQKWVIHTQKVTNAEPKIIRDVFGRMPEIKGIESLMEGIILATDNVRLKGTNLVTLLTLLKGTWYGTNSKEIITVATEHPPTWMAIIYAALFDRTYRSSTIAKIAERVGKRNMLADYVKQYDRIIEKYQLSENYRSLASANLI